MANGDYHKELINRTNSLFEEMDRAEHAPKGANKRVLELKAAQRACDLARWLLASEQFRAELGSVPEAKESAGEALEVLSQSTELYEKFLEAERELLVQRGVKKKVAAAIIDGCRGLQGQLLSDFDPDQVLVSLRVLANLTCHERDEAESDINKPTGPLRQLTRRGFWLGGGSTVIALNVLGGLAIIIKTFGAGTPLAVKAAKVSKDIGAELLKHGL